MMSNIKPAYLAAAAALVGVALYVRSRPEAARAFGESAGAAAVDLATGIVGGALGAVSEAANAGVNRAAQAVTGDPSATLGGAVYDVTHSTPAKAAVTVAAGPLGVVYTAVDSAKRGAEALAGWVRGLF